VTLPADLEIVLPTAGKPLVFLLHGAFGDKDHMTNPFVTGFNHDYGSAFPPDRIIGWSWYPGIGPWSFELDPLKQVGSWRDALNVRGFGTVAYTQTSTTGPLQPAVDQLAEVVKLVTEELSEKEVEADFVLLAHSRGGLLARKFLVDYEPELTQKIRHVVTLHSPHQGDQLAFAGASLNTAISDFRASLGPKGQQALDAALRWLVQWISAPSYVEMAQGSQFLTTLAAAETALPNVQYHTFGGTSVVFSRILSWVYTAGSAIPRWHLPPFRHVTTMIELIGISPIATSLPNVVAEITEGEGDILVADVRAGLSFAVHRTNSLSHAEALWDTSLQGQVLELLGEPGVIWS
jgi:pimeloyl-ACP methyl ester carboxylesterase